MTDVRIKENDDGSLDEFVARDVDVHFEAMEHNQWWIGITLSGGETVHINCGAVNPGAKGFATLERGI